MNEKQKIELATARGFLALYNVAHSASFEVEELSDSPDVICRDANGERLLLEITLTEDRREDTKAALGRSDHRNIESFDPHQTASRLDTDVLASLLERLQDKLLKDYGARTALVVRSTSGVDWDWDTQLQELRRVLGDQRNPFDQGIWLVNRQMDRLFKLFDPLG